MTRTSSGHSFFSALICERIRIRPKRSKLPPREQKTLRASCNTESSTAWYLRLSHTNANVNFLFVICVQESTHSSCQPGGTVLFWRTCGARHSALTVPRFHRSAARTLAASLYSELMNHALSSRAICCHTVEYPRTMDTHGYSWLRFVTLLNDLECVLGAILRM